MSSAHDAAFHGDEALLETSLKDARTVNATFETSFCNPCSTPLHVAALYGNEGCVNILLNKGANPLLVDCWGHTAAHHAASEGHWNILKILISANNGAMDIMDEQDRTPLHVAAHAGHTECINVLLEHGDRISTVYVEQDGEEISIANPLHAAAAAGKADSLRMLIGVSAPGAIDAKDLFDRTPLHLAARNGHLACVKVLIEAGASVNAKNTWGGEALHLAARTNNAGAVEFLLKNGAEVNSTDNHAMSALHYAAQSLALPCMRLLLDSGAAVDELSTMKETPLSVAVEADTPEVDEAVSMLLSAGASMSCLFVKYDSFSDKMKSTIKSFVVKTSDAANYGLSQVAYRGQVNGLSTPELCSDIVSKILAITFGVEDEFLRILLNDRQEG